MTAYLLADEDDTLKLIERDEDGPGYQFVEVGASSEIDSIPGGHYIVFNGEVFILWDDEDDWAQRHSLDHQPKCLAPYLGLTYEELVSSLQARTSASVGSSAPPKPSPAPPPRSTLILPRATQEGDLFWRLSGYRNDRRITSNRAVAAGTYVTADSDIDSVRSGLAAVGRYALPNPFPANYARVVGPTTSSTPNISLGTVRPNYGQAGGGVEGLFSGATAANTVSLGLRELPPF